MSTLSTWSLFLLEKILYILHYFKHLLTYFFLDGTPPLPVHCPTESAHPAVMITRTGSGAGRDIALHLVKMGYTVLAGIRNQEEGESLEELTKRVFLEEDLGVVKRSGKIIPVILNLSAPSTILSAKQFISNTLKELGIPLIALINNSGVNSSLPNELMCHAYIKYALEVRLFGAVKLTQELLPLLCESRGRIINIGSMTQRMLYRNSGVHSPTQNAIGLITDVWRRELSKIGVVSCVIEPGVFRSTFQSPHQKVITEDFVELAETIFTGMLNENLLKYYVKGLDEMSTRVEHLAKTAPTSEHVIDALTHGLTSRWPKSVYTVGWDARLLKLIKITIGRNLWDSAMS
ncbi:hypothetical protein K7432_009423 [Basidiobolus ranarum]|uniref:Uncharacterized protein n=1 Tax=Basidiobolus ranarum TaxID=34480 RepID=A0ABR2WQB4_9FUNG